MSIKAICVDLDGTLTDERRRLCIKAIEEIRKAEQELPIILASGNVLPIARALASYIGTSAPVIAENGGIVNWKDCIEILADKKEAERAWKHLTKHLTLRRLFTDKWRVTEVGFYPPVDEHEVRKLLTEFDVDLGFTGFAYHLKSKRINKFIALKVCCRWLKISVDKVAAIGDAPNDLELLSNCALGVAVANAPPELKAVADYVTTRPYGGGAVDALQYVMRCR